MLKVIVGSAIGGLVAGGIALVAAGQARGSVVPAATTAYRTVIPVSTQPIGPTVSCAPHQEAAVARVLVNGVETATLACVDRLPQAYAAYPPAGLAPQAQFVSTGFAPVPVEPVPVARTAPAARARPARQVVYRDADDDVVRYEPDVRQQQRSVAKTAMIIGGSAGTGAGVGAMFGGKKGALIGAAIGGGAASIYEATKR
jgi:hypothetical protein